MFEDVEDITINYEEDGVQVIEELDKEIITRGAWATVLFRYRQWERSREGYGPERYTIRRYRRINGEYRQQAKFNISSVEQARKMVQVLERWIAEAQEGGAGGEEEEGD